MPPFQLLHPLRACRQRAKARIRAMRNAFLGILVAVGPCWASCVRPGGDRLYCSRAVDMRAVSLHLSFTFFGETCFGVCSLESIPAFWSGRQRTGAMCWLWSAGALSLCPRLGIVRRDGTGAEWTQEIFRAEVFKGFPELQFSGKWGRTPYALLLWPYVWWQLTLQHLLCIF